MPKKDQTIDIINDTFDNVAKSIVQPPTLKTRKNMELSGNMKDQPPALRKQFQLDLGVEVQKDINGIEMGVLENGIPYLTQRGLAKITGAAPRTIRDITQEWEENFDDDYFGKDRLSFLKQYLFKQGYTERSLYIETKKDGTIHYAYPDIVCMAILEYYAFESKGSSDAALRSYRQFAAFGLHKFIYEALNYTPSDKWKYHHDRVSILKDSSPPGHFTIFSEVTGLIVDLITANLTVNDKTVPDISVGIAWGKHWSNNSLQTKYGNRIKYEHNYPEYYPQAMSNPQEPWAYPDEALPEFRRWFKSNYLTTKFPSYILKKANVISGGKEEVEKIASMYNEKQIGHDS